MQVKIQRDWNFNKVSIHTCIWKLSQLVLSYKYAAFIRFVVLAEETTTWGSLSQSSICLSIFQAVLLMARSVFLGIPTCSLATETHCMFADGTQVSDICPLVLMYILSNGRRDITEPRSIIESYLRNFLKGRPLDVIERETSTIFISRKSVFNDASSEVRHLQNIRLPLEVCFFGESAVDLGGPRKEFFALFTKEFIGRMLDEDGSLVANTDYVARQHYFYAGLILGKFIYIPFSPLRKVDMLIRCVYKYQ